MLDMESFLLLVCVLLDSSLSTLSVFDDSVMYTFKWQGENVLDAQV